MKNFISTTSILVGVTILLIGCGPRPTTQPSSRISASPFTQTATESTQVTVTPTVTPTLTPTPGIDGRIIFITSSDDSGESTLRQALFDAKAGDIIKFDPDKFPFDNPGTINLESSLPELKEGYLTIDASDAGVILDGSLFPDGWDSALIIVSNGNVINGLQIFNFSGAAIQISGGQDNLIHNNVIGRSDFGIGIWGPTTINNQIIGNSIGVSADGMSRHSNMRDGVILMEGANANYIGPDNLIAYNNGNGINITDEKTTGNSILANEIFGNGQNDINLSAGGNENLGSAIVLDFDLNIGMVHGLTCSDCTVEIYSNLTNGRISYEGQTTADGKGNYSFEKGSPLAGTAIITTTTDQEGNTSEFSTATIGLRKSLLFQRNNDSQRSYIPNQPVANLMNNRIGDMFPLDLNSCPESGAQDWAVTHVDELGLKWVRLSIDRFDGEQAHSMGLYSHKFVSDCQDKVVEWFVENDVTIMYTIVFWDENLNVGAYYPRYRNDLEVQKFLDYTRFIVQHFKGKVKYYEILNESISGTPQQYVEVNDYIDLIYAVQKVILEEDPNARVVAGGATNLLYEDSQNYLFNVIESNVMPLVEGIGLHSMYGTSPQYDETRQYYYDYPSFFKNISDIASKSGFSGEIFAEEMNWRTDINQNPYEPWDYSKIVAGKYYGRGIVTNLGMNAWAGIGGENYENILPVATVVRGLCQSLAGAEPDVFSFEVQSGVNNLQHYSFSFPNGDRLIALWTDGVAVDDDPGVDATILTPGVADWTALGIDILNNYQQNLITYANNGNLVISNVIIRDYPTIIRLIN